MARNRGMGDQRRQASDAKSGAHGGTRPANAPRLALPTDLGRSLRLLDDEQLDCLEKAVVAEVRRRGRHAAASLPAAGAHRAQKSGPATPAGSKSDAPNRPAVTPGQERLILAAFEAGLGPAAIAREVRLPLTTVRQVIAPARRNRHKPQR